jgi:hypothetical protein
VLYGQQKNKKTLFQGTGCAQLSAGYECSLFLGSLPQATCTTPPRDSPASSGRNGVVRHREPVRQCRQCRQYRSHDKKQRGLGKTCSYSMRYNSYLNPDYIPAYLLLVRRFSLFALVSAEAVPSQWFMRWLPLFHNSDAIDSVVETGRPSTWFCLARTKILHLAGSEAWQLQGLPSVATSTARAAGDRIICPIGLSADHLSRCPESRIDCQVKHTTLQGCII